MRAETRRAERRARGPVPTCALAFRTAAIASPGRWNELRRLPSWRWRRARVDCCEGERGYGARAPAALAHRARADAAQARDRARTASSRAFVLAAAAPPR